MSDSISTESSDVALVLTALELTKIAAQQVGAEPEALAEAYKTIYKAVYQAHRQRGSSE